jgi:hypothetical protein
VASSRCNDADAALPHLTRRSVAAADGEEHAKMPHTLGGAPKGDAMRGVRRDWFPAVERRRPFTVVDFETSWCAGSVVAHVVHASGGRRPRVELRLEAPADPHMA